jgi:hypothetical protein
MKLSLFRKLKRQSKDIDKDVIYGHFHQHKISWWEKIKMFFGWKNKRFITNGCYHPTGSYNIKDKLNKIL